MQDFFQPYAPVVQHAAPVAKHVAKHVAAQAPIIKQGFSMLTTLIASAVSFVAGGGLGYYIRNRGVKGVEQDLANAKAEIAKLTHTAQTPAA